jgi:hypothetical protein
MEGSVIPMENDNAAQWQEDSLPYWIIPVYSSLESESLVWVKPVIHLRGDGSQVLTLLGYIPMSLN